MTATGATRLPAPRLQGYACFGQTFLLILISGGIDLSVDATMGLTAVLMALAVVSDPGSIGLLIALALLAGGGVGLANGLLVTRLRTVPFIATLASSSIVLGIALQMRKVPPGVLPPEYVAVFTGQVGFVPIPVALVLAAALGAGLSLRYSAFGRRLYAIGSNEEAARLSGLSLDRTRVAAYIIAGVMAGLTGAFLVARSRAGDPLAWSSFTFDSVTAVVMGGVNVWGGRGSVYGTVAAVLIVAILGNTLDLLGMSTYVVSLMKGFLLMGVVVLYYERG